MFVFSQWGWLSDKMGPSFRRINCLFFGQWGWLSDKIGSLI